MMASMQSEGARNEEEIIILRRSLELDRKRFQEESGMMSFVAEQARGTVLLDVGGVHHQTSLMTLTSVPGPCFKPCSPNGTCSSWTEMWAWKQTCFLMRCQTSA